MLKNITIFKISDSFFLPALTALEDVLRLNRFLPCEPAQEYSSGWVAPRRKGDLLVEPVGKGAILRLQVERRVVPASAVKDAVDAMVEKYKQETGRERVGAKVKKEFKEEAIQTLLPRAFPKRSSTTLWIDPVNHWLVADGSAGGADLAVSALIQALAALAGADCTPASIGLLAEPLRTSMEPATAMAQWLIADAPHGFTVDRDCELKTQDDSKAAVRYSSHTLEIAEVAEHIAAGKLPVKLAMTWDGRVSFELSDAGQLRKLKLLDVVLDGQQGDGDDGFDTDAAIVTGELTALIPDLLEALGGEVEVDA